MHCGTTFIVATPLVTRTTVHIKSIAVSGAQKGSGSGYAVGSLVTPLSAVKLTSVKGSCGRKSRAKEKKALVDTKLAVLPLRAAQAAHPQPPAPFSATGPHHRPRPESGAGDEKLFAKHGLPPCGTLIWASSESGGLSHCFPRASVLIWYMFAQLLGSNQLSSHVEPTTAWYNAAWT